MKKKKKKPKKKQLLNLKDRISYILHKRIPSPHNLILGVYRIQVLDSDKRGYTPTVRLRAVEYVVRHIFQDMKVRYPHPVTREDEVCNH